MKQVEFGNTPYKVKRLGFGAMRLPTLDDGTVDFDRSTPLLRYGIEHGINCMDSHHGYHGGQSEEAIGKAIEGFPREKIILQTKIGMYSNYKEKQCWELLEQALVKMKTDYIDFYLTHSMGWESYEKHNKLFIKFTQKAIDRGLIKYRGFSSHDNPENVKKYINSGDFSVMLVQYNLLNRSYEDVISLAHQKGLGVEVMGPIAGGMLSSPNTGVFRKLPVQVSNTAALALRFVFANSHVHVVLSGMSSFQQVKENLVTADAVFLSPDDIKKVDEVFQDRKKLLELYCTDCKYCLPCPNKVNIPAVFTLYNLSRVYGFHEKAKQRYLVLDRKEGPSSCVECGKCEEKCPHNIPNRKRLKEIAEYFK